MNRKFMVVLLILIARSLFIFSVVNGKPNRITAIDTIDVDSSNRAKRDVVAIAAVSVIYGVSLASMSISNSNKCSVDAGCKRYAMLETKFENCNLEMDFYHYYCYYHNLQW